MSPGDWDYGRLPRENLKPGRQGPRVAPRLPLIPGWALMAGANVALTLATVEAAHLLGL